VVAAETTVELEERKGSFVAEVNRRLVRVDFTLAAPKGWEVARSDDDDKAMDGSGGMYQVAAPGTAEKRPYMMVSGVACERDCTLEAFDKLWAVPAPESKRIKVLRRELLKSGVGIVVRERLNSKANGANGENGAPEAIVEWVVPGELPVTVQCMTEVFEPNPALFAQLTEACVKLVVSGVSDVLGGELLAGEEAKVAQCPATTSVTYTAEDSKVLFIEVKRALALVERPGRIALRMGSTETTELGEGNPGDGAVRFEFGIIAAEGQEVTSGTYTNMDPPPPVVDARIVLGGKLTAAVEGGRAGEVVVIAQEGGAENLVWTGAELKVEVVARTKTKICGRFHFKDESHQARGEFNLDIP
jgi:hypothetical protein